MLFFFYYTTANLPIGVDCNSVYLVISITNAMIYNLLNIIEQFGRQLRFALELIEIIVFFHNAKVHDIFN